MKMVSDLQLQAPKIGSLSSNKDLYKVTAVLFYYLVNKIKNFYSRIVITQKILINMTKNCT